ncbi:MAG: hypothetical protein IKX30_01595, partial [Victivallales bacterium]|nr:hypothetical protein [Victivallales bacterium]
IPKSVTKIMTKSVTKLVTKSKSVNGPVNGPERLLDIIKANPGLRKAALASLSGLTIRKVKQYIENALADCIELVVTI